MGIAKSYSRNNIPFSLRFISPYQICQTYLKIEVHIHITQIMAIAPIRTNNTLISDRVIRTINQSTIQRVIQVYPVCRAISIEPITLNLKSCTPIRRKPFSSRKRKRWSNTFSKIKFRCIRRKKQLSTGANFNIPIRTNIHRLCISFSTSKTIRYAQGA